MVFAIGSLPHTKRACRLGWRHLPWDSDVFTEVLGLGRLKLHRFDFVFVDVDFVTGWDGEILETSVFGGWEDGVFRLNSDSLLTSLRLLNHQIRWLLSFNLARDRALLRKELVATAESGSGNGLLGVLSTQNLQRIVKRMFLALHYFYAKRFLLGHQRSFNSRQDNISMVPLVWCVPHQWLLHYFFLHRFFIVVFWPEGLNFYFQNGVLVLKRLHNNIGVPPLFIGFSYIDWDLLSLWKLHEQISILLFFWFNNNFRCLYRLRLCVLVRV